MYMQLLRAIRRLIEVKSQKHRKIAHLTSAHLHTDIRIFIKEVQTLACALPQQIVLVVADGKGNKTKTEGPAVYDLGKPNSGRVVRALLCSVRAFLFIRRGKPEIVHFHDPELMPLGLLLKLFGHKVIYDVHEDVPRQIMSKHWIPVILRTPVAVGVSVLECLVGKVFDAIVPATPTIAARFPRNKTVLVQNFPIKAELVTPKPVPYQSRPHAVAYVGGIANNRGAKEMVMAMGYLGDTSGLSLEMAGVISPDSVGNELRALPAWSLVNYHNHIGRPEVANLLGNVRAGLVLFHPMPNHVDAQPNKMFEYMAAGLPVIASNFPLWRQIIEGAQCGLLVDPLNPQAIADAIRWILEHPVESEAMGQRGRKAVEEAYNWDNEAVKLIVLYKKLLAV